MKISIVLKPSGQALVEYLLVLLFVIMISVKAVGLFTDFMRDSMGNFGHVLSTYLTTGVCPRECFFGRYRNGYGD